MASKFNCPNCGAPNEFSGEGNIVRCSYCGQDVHPPEEMVTQAATARLSSQTRVWIIVFIVVVFVIPTCLSFGGALLGVVASVLGALAAFFGSFIGFFVGK